MNTGKQTKILLINPPLVMRSASKTLYPPLGLAYMAACLEHEGFSVAILDAYAEGAEFVTTRDDHVVVGMKDDQIAESIKKHSPDIIGISYNFTHFHDSLFTVANIAKSVDPCILVVCGGHHVTMDWESAIHCQSVDMIVKGEGEAIMLEIAQRVETAGDLKSVAGTVAKNLGEVIDNGFGDSIADIDALPLPAYHKLRMDLYLKDQRKLLFPFAMRQPIGFMIASRGCPYNCIFCSTSKVFKKFRPRNPALVVDEIEYLVQHYGVKEIAFQDDCFLGNIGVVESICKLLVEKRTAIKWTVPPGLPVWRVKPELLRLMRDAGFYRVCFPIESGCKETIRYIRKPVDLDAALATIAEANKLGMWTYGNLIVGFPEETQDQVQESIRYFMKSELDMISVYICQPHAGSDLYEKYRHQGLIEDQLKTGSNIFETQYDTVHFTASQLNRMRGQVLSDFMAARIRSLFSWKGLCMHLLYKIRSFEDLLYVIRIFSYVLKQSILQGSLRYF